MVVLLFIILVLPPLDVQAHGGDLNKEGPKGVAAGSDCNALGMAEVALSDVRNTPESGH